MTWDDFHSQSLISILEYNNVPFQTFICFITNKKVIKDGRVEWDILYILKIIYVHTFKIS